MTGHRSAGFTLIEVLVSLVVAGLIALAAHRLVLGVGDAARQVRAARESLDREQNARRWLKAALLSVEAGEDAGSFEGEPDRLTFSTWLEQPGGWMARRRLNLGLMRGALTAWSDRGDTVRLADSVDSVQLDYLLEPGLESRWVRRWSSPVRAPLAVRLVVRHWGGPATAADTLLLLVGERG